MQRIIRQFLLIITLLTFCSAIKENVDRQTSSTSSKRQNNNVPNISIYDIIQPYFETVTSYLQALKLSDVKKPIIKHLVEVQQPPPQGISQNGSFLTSRLIFQEKKAQNVSKLATSRAVTKVLNRYIYDLNFTNDPGNLKLIDFNSQQAALSLTNIFQANPFAPGETIFYQPPHNYSDGSEPFIGNQQAFGNIDAVYQLQIVSGFFDYVINGTYNPENPPIDITFALTAGNLVQQALLTIDNITLNDDGKSFTIIVGQGPANGRKNFLQSTFGSYLLQMRTLPKVGPKQDPTQALGYHVITAIPSTLLTTILRSILKPLKLFGIVPQDVSVQKVLNSLQSVAVLNDQIYAALLTYGGISLWSTQRKFIDYVTPMPTNQFPQPTAFAKYGFYSSEIFAISKVTISDKQAMVVTADLGEDGKYLVATCHDKFGFVQGLYQYQSSLNNLMAKPNTNGTITFIFAKSDPGYYNWVDTIGLNVFLAKIEWIKVKKPILVNYFVSEISDLDQNMEEGQKVDNHARERQLQEYRSYYKHRYQGY